MAKIPVTYTIGSIGGTYTKVYDGTKLQANAVLYDGVQEGDSFRWQITNKEITHVGTLTLKCDDGYPQIWSGDTEVTETKYEVTQIPTSFTITARDITLQSESFTKEYDGTPLVGSGTVTDLTAGETDKGYVSGEEFTYSNFAAVTFVTETPVANTFTCGDSLTASVKDYNINYKYGTLTVTGRTTELTITVLDQTKEYDGSVSFDPTMYSVSGLAYNDTITVTLSVGELKDAGTYENAITVKDYTIMHENGDGTYTDVTDMYLNVNPVEGDLTITPRKVTLQSESDWKYYDGTPLTNSIVKVHEGSFVGTDSFTADVTGSQTVAGTSENSYTYELTEGTKAGNYEITQEYGDLVVKPIETVITITANNATKTYDGTALTAAGYTYTQGILLEGDTLTAVTEGTITDAGTGKNTIKSYMVVNSKGEDVTACYTIATADGTLTIEKRDVTLTSASDSKEYDGTPLTNSTVTVSGEGFAGTEGATYTFTGSQTDVGSSKNEFSYTLTNGAKAENYNIETVYGDLTVTPVSAVITITADSNSKTYDGTALTDEGYTYTQGILFEGDVLTAVTEGTITDAGTAENKIVKYTVMRGTTDVTKFYTIATAVGTLTVDKRAVTLTSASDTKEYDGTPLTNDEVTVSGDGFVKGEGATYTVTGSQTKVGTSKNKFSYTLNAGTKAANYDITTVEGDLTVTTIGELITITANSNSKMYDGKALTDTGYTYTSGVLREGDVLTAVVQADDTLINVGDVANVVTEYKVMRGTEDVTDCYSIVTENGTLTVTARKVTFTSASSTKEYDGKALTNSTVTVTGDGFVGTEDVEFAVTGSQTIAGTSKNEFSYTLTNGAKAENYNIEKVYGDLTVTQNMTAITITANDANKLYDGTALTADGYTYTGKLAEGDTLIGVVTEGTITNAGTGKNTIKSYTIVNSKGEDVTESYGNITTVDGTLTVDKRSVTLTSASDKKAYDGVALTNSTVTVTGDGFIEGEGAKYEVTGSQLFVGSSANKFTYTLNEGTLAENYDIKTVEGTLEVTKNETVITITAGSATKKYDGAALTWSGYTYTQDIIAGDKLIATMAGSITDAGEAANEVVSWKVEHENDDGTKTDVTDSYTFAEKMVDGKLTVTARKVTFTSASDTKEYDGTALTNDEVTVTGDGFVKGEGATFDVTGSQTKVGSSDNTFKYELNAGTKKQNYEVTEKYGTLAVTKNTKVITITAGSDTKTYDGTALTCDTFTYTQDIISSADKLSVTMAGSITDAGTAVNEVASWKVTNGKGEDVTEWYTFAEEMLDGTLTVKKRSVTLTSGNATKKYDGKALTNSSVVVSGEKFVDTEGAKYKVTGSQLFVGTSANTFTYTLKSNTKVGNYDITTVAGTLTVTARTITLTITANDQTKTYDATTTLADVTETAYTVTGLAYNDYVKATISTTAIDAGTYEDGITIDSYTIWHKNEDGTETNVTSMYANVVTVSGDLTINKRDLTVTAGSASKVYDGTALTCETYEVTAGSLVEGQTIADVSFSKKSTVTHVEDSPVANKIESVTIKADDTDVSKNYNITTVNGALKIAQRSVLLQSTSAEKYYDGTALQNRQVIVTGFHYDESGKVVEDENAGFLEGDGCTYKFKDDNCVIDKDGNIIAWEQKETKYGQTEVGVLSNEFEHGDFTSVYYGSKESDYIIMDGSNQEALGLGKDERDLFGSLTVRGGPVEINMTDYSWTYDYQAKTNGYFDDGYTVVVTTDEEGTQQVETTFAHNSEGKAVELFGNDTIVVTVTGEDGSKETGKVQHVGDDKQNEATYAIYRNGVDVTEELKDYYDISIAGGLLQITPRTVELTSGSSEKEYDGKALTNNEVTVGSEGHDTGFVYGEGAAYEVTGSQTNIGTSANTFAISELLQGTQAADYNFEMTDGKLTVKPVSGSVESTTAGNFSSKGGAFQLLQDGQACVRTVDAISGLSGTLTDVANWKIIGTGDFNGSGKDGLLWQDLTTSELVMQYDMTSLDEVNNKTNVLGIVEAGYTAKATGDFSGTGIAGALIQTPETGDISVSTTRGLACFARENTGDTFVGWLGALVNTWDKDVELKGDLTDTKSINANNYRYEVVAVGDFNGDGRDDVMLQNTMPTEVEQGGTKYTITGSGDVFTFLTGSEEAIKRGDDPTIAYTGCAKDGWEILGIGDFDADGVSDVLLGKGNDDGTTTLAGWNMANGTRQADFVFDTLTVGNEFVGIADFNADGTDDLLIATGDELTAWTIEKGKVTGTLAIA